MQGRTNKTAGLAGLSEVADIGRIFLGAIVGAIGGMVVGGLVYDSLVVAVFSGMGGAVAGMIGSLKHWNMEER